MAVVVASTGVAVYINLNDGTGRLAAPVTYPVGGTQPASYIVTADFNGDGRLDLATSSYFTNAISVLYNHGDGTFGRPSFVGVGVNSGGLGAGDFNGDGRVDLVSIDPNSGNLLLLLNNGDGTLKRPRPVRTDSAVFAFVVADFNNDGHPDLATSNTNNDDSVAVLINRGDGVFSNPRYYAVGNAPFDIATGDFNNDGYLDLVTANVNVNTFSVLFNRADGTGTFRQAISFPGTGGEAGVITADVNHDGLTDIVGANPFGDNIMVLLNKGGRTFLPPISCDVGPGRLGPYHPAAADFNGDGRIDILTGNRATLSVLLTGG